MAHFLVSAAHKSSGKTVLAAGLAAAFRRRGMIVQPFKKGPDYIDPMWLGLAAGRPCHNLDFYTMSEAEILSVAGRMSQGADVSIIEGNKGLYDGLDLDGSTSNAALARLLGAPVLLVLDARGMTRGIAPLILGYQAFDSKVRIGGVILNKVGGSRHEGKLRAIIEHYTDVAVLGAVHNDEKLRIPERHLGLIPSNEAAAAAARIDALADAVTDQVDLDRVIGLAAEAVPLPSVDLPSVDSGPTLPAPVVKPVSVRIGIARDAAFGFYYPGDLEAMETAGAQLVPFDTLHDSRLPPVDGLFIGGGFPETHMKELEANGALRAAIRQAIEAGLPAYAECGGLMYLARSLTWKGEKAAMAGVIPGDVVMHDRPRGRGYVRLRETGNSPWPILNSGGLDSGGGGEIAAHEFHYSSLENLEGEPVYAYDVMRGWGLDGDHDGLVINNLVASYAHLRNGGANPWAERFVAFVSSCKDGSCKDGSCKDGAGRKAAVGSGG